MKDISMYLHFMQIKNQKMQNQLLLGGSKLPDIDEQNLCITAYVQDHEISFAIGMKIQFNLFENIRLSTCRMQAQKGGNGALREGISKGI